MTLLEKQFLLMRLLPNLINLAHNLGFEVTEGDGYRDPRVFGPIGSFKGYGHAKSAHKQRLAVDLNLFRDGKYLADTESHRQLGEWWEQQNELCRWGGRFTTPDGNHYSLFHEGVM